MQQIVRNISFWLLMQDAETKKIIESGDEKVFEDVLYSKWGVDIHEPFEIKSCEHRPVENDPFTFNGPIVLGVERIDQEWINSDKSTFDAQVAAKGDISFMMDIQRMSRRSSSDKAFSSREAGKRAVKQEMN